MPPGKDVAVAHLLAPSDQQEEAQEARHLAPVAGLGEGHLGDLASLANGTCSSLSTLKSACAHSHQMAIAPCGKGILCDFVKIVDL